MTTEKMSAILAAARTEARLHHSKYDPSHDIHHINRVVALSLLIAHSLPPLSSTARTTHAPVDYLVVELAALFHDLLDSKYMSQPITAKERLATFWAEHDDCSLAQMRLVERIIENVSYSKEVKRLHRVIAQEEQDWFINCVELHCVQDADKLDAIGALGIMRCAAYAGATNGALMDSQIEPVQSTAIDHFHDKLFKLESMMKTCKGREMARSRTEFMRSFINQIGIEVIEAERI